jgi:DNA-binding MarR family transcriptional regulator
MEYENRVLSALAQWPGISARVIRNRLKADKDKLSAAMADMERRGLIVAGVSKNKRNGVHLWVWRATPKGAMQIAAPRGKFDM